MQILIIGRNGQVAWELQRTLSVLGRVTALGRPEIDLKDLSSLRAAIRQHAPDLLVNAAAYTAVDQAESEPELAMRINTEAPRVMAEEMPSHGVFVHYSTDFVYDGQKKSAYLEIDDPSPLNVYGASKLAGEEAIRATGSPHFIFRTSWVYGTRGRNFLGTVLRLAAEQKTLRIVNDQIGAPTWCRDIAAATLAIASRLFEAGPTRLSAAARQLSGTYHMSAGGEVTWYEFACGIMADLRSLGFSAAHLPTVQPITSDEYQAPARRPHNSVLCNKKLNENFGVTLPHWRVSLRRVIEELADERRLPFPLAR